MTDSSMHRYLLVLVVFISLEGCHGSECIPLQSNLDGSICATPTESQTQFYSDGERFAVVDSAIAFTKVIQHEGDTLLISEGTMVAIYNRQGRHVGEKFGEILIVGSQVLNAYDEAPFDDEKVFTMQTLDGGTRIEGVRTVSYRDTTIVLHFESGDSLHVDGQLQHLE